jgi:hypothetical protein
VRGVNRPDAIRLAFDELNAASGTARSGSAACDAAECGSNQIVLIYAHAWTHEQRLTD